MPPRLTVMTLGVDDIARSRAFYESLGFTASADSNANVVFFDAGGVVLAIWGRQALAEDAGVPGHGSGFRGVCCAWNVASEAEADEALARATAAGAKLVKAGQKSFWGGYLGYFEDPDGHLWEVTHNPFWEMDDSGRITLPKA